MGLSNSGWTACTNGTCRCTGRALAAIRDNPSNLNHLPLDHARFEPGPIASETERLTLKVIG